MRLAILGCLAAVGCKSDYETLSQKKVLTTFESTFDANQVAVGDRQTLTVILASTGQGAVTVYDVYLEDAEDTAWVVLDSWKGSTTSTSTGKDLDGDGVDDATEIEGGNESDPGYALVEVSFRPPTQGYFRQTLIIESDDSEVEERTEEDHGIWKVIIRGIGAYPCAVMYPLLHDFGPNPAGGYFSTVSYIENCGNVKLTISDFSVEGDSSFYVDTPTPLYVLPWLTEPFTVGWIPTGEDEGATVSLTANDPDFDSTLSLRGNTCTSTSSEGWDEDGDGFWACEDDCDDDDPGINPNADEIADGQDNDCDGRVDEAADSRDSDNDGDDYTESEGDCNDDDDEIHPSAQEIVNNRDDDCNGFTDEGSVKFDDDRDGFSDEQGDCDDDDPDIHPGASEVYNEIDDDCDGLVDEGSYAFDDDGDGFTELGTTADDIDCNDNDPWTYPGATEDCDERDNDCDNEVDESDTGGEGGACAFKVSRDLSDSSNKKGCATTGAAAGSVVLALLGLALGSGRRRSHRPE